MPFIMPFPDIKKECLEGSWYWKPLGVKVTFKPMNVPNFNIFQYTNHYGVYARDGTINELDNSHNFSTLRAALSGGSGQRGIRKHICKGTKTIFLPWKGRNIPQSYRIGDCNTGAHGYGSPFNVMHNDRGYYRTEYVMRGEENHMPQQRGYTMFFIETPYSTPTDNNEKRDFVRQTQVVQCTMTFLYRTIGPRSNTASVSGGPFAQQASMFLPWARYEPHRTNLEIYNPGNFSVVLPSYDDHACDSEPTPHPIECGHPYSEPPLDPVPEDPVPEDPLPEDPPAPQQSPLLFTPTVEDRTGICPFKKNVTFE
ncbi:MAG: hypothetical protein KVP17_001485 [Porospora cf. gigantea B]|uniref:uncharacterized protein n=1 Tax=Porospora cf. gigantea B TaxID=2853592 RepID=UPI003571DE55|nr:MAG: hypothetical protein KVP17_001485 [Porospora cf. gigantea B]